MIECYVQARYPVILAVNAREWAEPKPLLLDGPARGPEHAVTVVGVRKASVQNREEQLIVHDPARQPFLERSAKFCFKACWKYGGGRPAVTMIMPVERSVRRSLNSCWQYLYRQHPAKINGLMRGRSRGDARAHDYQFALAYAKDVQTFLWPVPLGGGGRAALDGQFALGAGRYWCVAAYQDRHLTDAWLFPAAGGADDGWALRLYRRNPDGRFRLHDPIRGDRFLNVPPTLRDALARFREA